MKVHAAPCSNTRHLSGNGWALGLQLDIVLRWYCGAWLIFDLSKVAHPVVVDKFVGEKLFVEKWCVLSGIFVIESWSSRGGEESEVDGATAFC